jgi:flavin-dependent dehydrogenase
MTMGHVQNLVIGSGVAGKVLAWTLAKQGQKTVVVERSMVGGMPYTALHGAIFTHPTTAEGLVGLFANPPSAPGPKVAFPAVA